MHQGIKVQFNAAVFLLHDIVANMLDCYIIVSDFMV